MHLKDYTRNGSIEVGIDGRLEVIEASDSIKALLEKVASEIDTQPCLSVTYGDETPVTVDKQSGDYDFGLRLELMKRGLTVTAESSYYYGRSSP